MTTQFQGNYGSFEAAADLSEKTYYIVKLDANNKAVLASAATDAILGVLFNAPKLGETADVAIINGTGTGKVILGGNVTKDAYLTTDASGKAIATTTTGNRVFGRAATAGTTGDVIEYHKLNEKY